ncbi:uncharacterized protein SETTUDRAFT_39978 [Exserohilum turcica Et28A]|uniref:Uncharacterized protein n=1 Tax=Exserohilum turcicum (strain 28A) TaxID=671987 RepID=R0IMC4_EXST2|nr:uncharacterized protein SETTUDRAFT_39978 [Exserohilum turcica Et28A]EOA85961.1 hypothetical protein SETTUDRAFT_39978 [Exserohilum turcica Et28A]
MSSNKYSYNADENPINDDDTPPTLLDQRKLSIGRELICACLSNSEIELSKYLQENRWNIEPDMKEVLEIALMISLRLKHFIAAKVLIRYKSPERWAYKLLREYVKHEYWVQAIELLSTVSTLDEIRKYLSGKRFYKILQVATTKGCGYTQHQICFIQSFLGCSKRFDYPYSDVNKKQKEGGDPLTQAILAGSDATVALLLRKGITAHDKHIIAAQECIESAKEIESAVNPGLRKRKRGNESLERAIKKVLQSYDDNSETEVN